MLARFESFVFSIGSAVARLALAGLVVGSSIGSIANAGPLEFRSLEDEMDQRIGGALCFYQDATGYIYIGTRWAGMHVFNGYESIVYKNDPANPKSLSDDEVNFIFEDREGRLFRTAKEI